MDSPSVYDIISIWVEPVYIVKKFLKNTGRKSIALGYVLIKEHLKAIVFQNLAKKILKLYRFFVEDRYKVVNGVALCDKCHRSLHNRNINKKIINIYD